MDISSVDYLEFQSNPLCTFYETDGVLGINTLKSCPLIRNQQDRSSIDSISPN